VLTRVVLEDLRTTALIFGYRIYFTLEYLMAASTSYFESSACTKVIFEHALFAELYSHFCKSNPMLEVRTDIKKIEELVTV